MRAPTSRTASREIGMNDASSSARAGTIHAFGGAYDLVVVGAGSGGFAAAIRGAELGAQVALIGHGTIGGTCVNVGCVPSKTLIRAMDGVHGARTLARFAGIEAAARVTDWSALVAQKDELVAELRQTKYMDVLSAYPAITYVDGQARLADGGVTVDGSLIGARKIVVATGARPASPQIPGLAEIDALDSTTVMELERLPKSLLVMGGGDIGAELAQLFARAGVRVALVCRSRLLPNAEPEISAALTRAFAAEGITVRSGITYERLRNTAAGVALSLAGGEVIEAERLLVATGRTPNSDGLGLRKAGVERASDGAIRVDEQLRTTRPGVYAVGDVTGRDMHVYMAAYAGRLAVDNALDETERRYDAATMPMVTFTDPQAASVGLSEREARDQGLDVRTSVLPLEYLPRALAARDTGGLIKLVATGDRLIGAHILAPEGGDSIQTATLAIKHGMTVSELAETIFPYLTTVEGLKLAAQAFDKDVAKLSCCAA